MRGADLDGSKSSNNCIPSANDHFLQAGQVPESYPP